MHLFNAFWYSYLHLSRSPRSPFLGASALILWVMLETWVSLAASHSAGEVGHSLAPLPFFPWEGSPTSFFSKQCYLEERDEVGKFHLQICPNSLVLFWFGCKKIQDSSSRDLGFYKRSLISGYLPNSVFSRYSWMAANRHQNHFIGSCQFYSPYGDLSTYVIHRWVRLLLGPLEDCTGSHSSHKGTFGHE